MTKPEKIFDGLLVLQYRKGSKKALSLLVKRWHIKFCKHGYYYVKDREVAKDIAQDSWRVILKSIGKLEDVNSFGSWALVIVNRKAIDYLRKKQKTDGILHQYYETAKINYDTIETAYAITNDRVFTNTEGTETIMSSIKKLPENQQIILRLFYLEEYSILEICKILEISKGTVKSRLFYAREKLKLILKNKK